MLIHRATTNMHTKQERKHGVETQGKNATCLKQLEYYRYALRRRYLKTDGTSTIFTHFKACTHCIGV